MVLGLQEEDKSIQQETAKRLVITSRQVRRWSNIAGLEAWRGWVERSEVNLRADCLVKLLLSYGDGTACLGSYRKNNYALRAALNGFCLLYTSDAADE